MHPSLHTPQLNRASAAVAVVFALVVGVLIGRATIADPILVAAGPASTPTASVPQTETTRSTAPTAVAPATSETFLGDTVPAATEELASPTRIAIPRLGIDQSLIQLGVNPDRTLEVPTNGDDIGWWRSGPVPGEPGNAVIAAHVSWNGGQPAAFSDLTTLIAGDEVVVNRQDGSTATYQVTSTEQYPKNAFPNDLIYRLDGDPALSLITCGGAFVGQHYLDNIVVFADIVSDTRMNTTS